MADAVYVSSIDSISYDHYSHDRCAIRGCDRMGKFRLLYRSENMHQKAGVCSKHIAEIMENLLMYYQFNHDHILKFREV